MDKYPGLLRRVAATLIDLGAVFLVVRHVIQEPLVADSAGVNAAIAVAFVFMYEPLMTVYACTFGHALMAIRVRHFETLERITLGKAYLRFVLKYVASVAGAAASRGMVRVWPRDDRRTIHDLQAGTVVVTMRAAEKR